MRRRVSSALAFCATLAGIAAIATSSGCAEAAPSRQAAEVKAFQCDGDVVFVASLRAGRATIATRSQLYELEARTSSIGTRYGAGEVAFALDEERAVLIGAADGPYENCIQQDVTRTS